MHERFLQVIQGSSGCRKRSSKAGSGTGGGTNSVTRSGQNPRCRRMLQSCRISSPGVKNHQPLLWLTPPQTQNSKHFRAHSWSCARARPSAFSLLSGARPLLHVWLWLMCCDRSSFEKICTLDDLPRALAAHFPRSQQTRTTTNKQQRQPITDGRSGRNAPIAGAPATGARLLPPPACRPRLKHAGPRC